MLDIPKKRARKSKDDSNLDYVPEKRKSKDDSNSDYESDSDYVPEKRKSKDDSDSDYESDSDYVPEKRKSKDDSDSDYVPKKRARKSKTKGPRKTKSQEEGKAKSVASLDSLEPKNSIKRYFKTNNTVSLSPELIAITESIPHPQSIPPPLLIPSPDPSLFEMSKTNDQLRKLAHPIALASFEGLLERNLVLDPFQVEHSSVELTSSLAVIYAMVCTKTGELLKIGYSRNLQERDRFYREEGYEDFVLIAMINLDRLDDAIDTFLRAQHQNLLEAVRESDTIPQAIKKLFQMYADRGGEELGTTKTAIIELVEMGCQLCLGLYVPGELLIYDESKDTARRDEVSSALNVLVPLIDEALDCGKKIDVDFVSSWITAWHWQAIQNKDTDQLFATQCFIEYILSHPVNMLDRNALNLPVHPNATTNEEAFSDDFPLEKLLEGNSRLLEFLLGMPGNSILLVDANNVLFKRKLEGLEGKDMREHLEKQHGFRTLVDVWDGELLLLRHCAEKKVMLLHRTLGKAGEGRSEIKVWESVRRAMIMEMMRQVVLAFQSEEDRTITDFFGDAIFGAFAYEHAYYGLHAHKGVAAACVRDATIPTPVHALKRLRRNKAPEDPNYPIARNLREKLFPSRSAIANNPCPKRLNPLLIKRAKIRLAMVKDVNDLAEVEAAMEEVDAILREDKPGAGVYYRWKSVINDPKFNQESNRLGDTLQHLYDAAKANAGNPEARGHTRDELDRKEEQFQAMLALPYGTLFWLRNGTNDEPSPETNQQAFHEYTYGGIVGRLQEKDTSKATKPPVPLKCKIVLFKGLKQYTGTNDAFVLCCLQPKTTNEQALKEEQMQAIESLPYNTPFWLRKNSKSSSEVNTPDKHTTRSFNLPTLIGVRDRWNKNEESVHALRKVTEKEVLLNSKSKRGVESTCGLWQLCRVIPK